MSAIPIKHDRAWWQAHLRRIDREGITTQAYAEREGLSARQIYDKRKELKLASATAQDTMRVAKQAGASFVALQVAPGASTAPCQYAARCTLVLPSGVRLEMADLPSPQWLTALSADLTGARR